MQKNERRCSWPRSSSRASGKSADKKQEYADRAMALLHTAVQAGYKNAARMRIDTELDPIRARDDFQKLIADMKKPAPAKPDKP